MKRFFLCKNHIRENGFRAFYKPVLSTSTVRSVLPRSGLEESVHFFEEWMGLGTERGLRTPSPLLSCPPKHEKGDGRECEVGKPGRQKGAEGPGVSERFRQFLDGQVQKRD